MPARLSRSLSFRLPVLSALAALSALSCSLPPLRGRMEAGKDPYVIIAADGAGGSDLYAVRADNGESVPITFSALAEYAPSLSPDGGMVAFLRKARSGDTATRVWVMNLLSGTDRELVITEGAGTIERLAWSPDGRTVYGAAGSERYAWPAPPVEARGRLLGGSEAALADRALTVELGDPPIASVAPCAEGGGMCARTLDGTALEQQLVDVVTPLARWGRDSVAWVRGNTIEVRPLGPGKARILEPVPARAGVSGVTVFGGSEK